MSDQSEGSPFRAVADEEFDLRERPYSVYQCEDCDNVVLSLHGGGALTCHGETMVEVEETQMSVEPPALRDVLLDVFGMPRAGLDICLCVIDEGMLTPAEVADRLDYDESTVRRYLAKLIDVGLLQRTQLNREDGGFVNVYRPIDVEEMRRESLAAFYVWAGEAATLLEEANLTKEEYLDADPEERLTEIFWEELDT